MTQALAVAGFEGCEPEMRALVVFASISDSQIINVPLRKSEELYHIGSMVAIELTEVLLENGKLIFQ